MDSILDGSLEETSQKKNEAKSAGCSNKNENSPERNVFNTITVFLFSPFKRFFRFLFKHPMITFFAFFNSFPNFINSLLAVLKVKAKNLSWALLLAAPLPKKILGVLLGISAFSVNVLLNAVFLPKAMKVLFSKDTWVKHPYRSTVALFLGIAGSIALGVIAFEAFSFSLAIAIPMAIAAIVGNFATRFVTASEWIRRLTKKLKPKKPTSTDKDLQEKYLEALQHLKKDCLKEINETLARLAQELDSSNKEFFYNELLLCLDKKLNELVTLDPDLVENKASYRAPEVAGLIFDILFATIMALSGYMIFAQKGFDGFTIISKWLSGPLNTTLEDMNKLFQILISSPSGIASAILYGMTAFDFRQILSSTFHYLYEHPQSIPYALVILSVNLLSGAPMFNVAANILLNPRSIFSSTIKLFPHLFTISGAMESIIVNTKSSLNKAYLNESNIDTPTVDDIVRYFANRKEHPISAEAFTILKQHTFFANFVSKNVPCRTTILDQVSTPKSHFVKS